MNQFDEFHNLIRMSKCFGPNVELLLLFIDFDDAFYESLINFVLKLLKLLS